MKLISQSMNAIIYLRVSSDEQVKNFSLDTQKEICEALVKRDGYNVVQTFREEGESAKTTNRPELLKLLEYCRVNKKSIGAVIIYKFDRLTRNTNDFLAIKAKLAEYAIKLISASEPTDDSPAGKFMETLFSAVSQLDNEVRMERTRNGLYKRFRSGLPKSVPLGYKMQQVDGRFMATEDDNFSLVRQAWELMLTNTMTLSKITDEMNQMGLVIKYAGQVKKITKQYASKLFKNKFYCGYVVSKTYNEEVLGQHTPMISETAYYQVQGLLRNRRQLPESIKKLRDNPLFPLRGIVRCSVCSRFLLSGNARGRNKVYPKYWCVNKCIQTVDADLLENQLKMLLSQIQPDQDLINGFTLLLRVKYESIRDTLIAQRKKTESDILEQKNFMSLLVEGNMSGKYSDEIFEEQKAKIEDKLLTLRVVSNDALCEKYDIDATVNFIKALYKDLTKAYEVSSLAQKKLFIGSIYPSGLSFNGESILNHGLSDGFKAISTLSETKNSQGVFVSALEFTRIEPIINSFNPLMLAYPDYQHQFAYAY